MFYVAKDGKVTIQIGKFYLSDYIETGFLDIIEEFSYAILQYTPACIWLQTSEKEYQIICNINECYIIDVKKKKVKKEKVSLIEIGKSLYQDLNKCRKNLLELNDLLGIDDTEDIIDMTLDTIMICNNMLRENFQYKKGNITQATLETLGYALYLHSAGVVYDEIDNEQIFRLYDYERTYIVIVKKKKGSNTTKLELIVIDKPIDEIAVETYIELKDKKKMKHTKELLDSLYDNILEYQPDFPEKLKEKDKEKGTA